MQILVHTHNTEEAQGLSAQVELLVEDVLSRFAGRLSRVEVHLRDENAGKGGQADKRCTMEARVEGRAPIAVTQRAPTVEQAVNGAAHKLSKSLGHLVEMAEAHGGARRR